MPTPANEKTPWPDDPRMGLGGAGAGYAAHSVYTFAGPADGWMWVTDIADPLSRAYLSQPGGGNCVDDLRKLLTSSSPTLENGTYTFCAMVSGGVPLHFRVAVKIIQFQGGKGVRYLISSSNYQTVNKLNYIFQGITDDDRLVLSFFNRGISHPYIVDNELFEENVGPLIAWRAGQYDEAIRSYTAFNQRIEQLLAAGAISLYPSLELLDAMMASIEIK
jgi:hypothetical protein